MSVFVSTDDGKVLLLRIDERQSWDMADFGGEFTDLALSPDGTLYGSSDLLVHRLDLGTQARQPVALVAGGGIVGIDVDGSGRVLIGVDDGRILRLEHDRTLTEIGQVPDGAEGGIARIGGFAYIATPGGDLAVMNLANGAVTTLLAHGLGTVTSVSAEDDLVRISVTPPSGTPQFFLYDPSDTTLTFENGLLNFYESITGATSGDLGTVVFTGGGGDEQIIGTALSDAMTADEGDDRVFARDGADTLRGGAGDDLLDGEEGNDRLDGGTGDDLMIGGTGLDWALYHGTVAATVNLQDETAQATGYGIDRLVGIENIEGSDAGDLLMGDASANILVGGGGDDTLIGRGGADNLRGDAGDDWFQPGAGNDTVKGGIGFDVVDYSDAGAGITLNLGCDRAQHTGGSGWERVLDVEGVIGSQSSDDLFGTGAANLFEGRAGHDTLRGGGGRDTLFGHGGDDDLRGGGGFDTLHGGGGDDRLDGGRGLAETLSTGGAGADTFVFVVSGAGGRMDGVLRITDFNVAQGDVVELIGASPADFANWTAEDLGGSRARIVFENGAEIHFDQTEAEDIVSGWFQ